MNFKDFRNSLVVGTLCVSSLLAQNSEAKAEYEEPQYIRTKSVSELAMIDWQSYLLTRADALPIDNFEDATDPFLEGYIQAMIDSHYNEFQVLVSVRDHKVYLYNLPKNSMIRRSMVSFVQGIPGVESVEIGEELPDQEVRAREIYVERPQMAGVWFPQETVLFQPLIANPRQVDYSAVYRYGDKVMGDNTIAVSIGDTFPIFRWFHVGMPGGDLQLDVEGGVWAVFNYSDIPCKKENETCELVNADYLLGIPVSYAFDEWSFRGRIYHISGHLGDEYLVNRPCCLCERVNPSFEALEFLASYQATPGIRVYFGPGFVIHSDSSFKIDPVYLDYGTEIRMFGTKFSYHRLYGTPFLAVDIENWQQHDWEFDIFIRAGYEISKLQGTGRKMRIFLGYHDGFSYEGQFFNERTSYGEFGISWGF